MSQDKMVCVGCGHVASTSEFKQVGDGPVASQWYWCPGCGEAEQIENVSVEADQAGGQNP